MVYKTAKPQAGSTAADAHPGPSARPPRSRLFISATPRGGFWEDGVTWLLPRPFGLAELGYLTVACVAPGAVPHASY